MPEMFETFAALDPFLCRHEGIGLPGCPTCDVDPERICAAYRWRQEKNDRALADLRQELQRAIDELARARGEAPRVRLSCPFCRTPHVDEGDSAFKVHSLHRCLSCGKEWSIEPPVFGATRSDAELPPFWFRYRNARALLENARAAARLAAKTLRAACPCHGTGRILIPCPKCALASVSAPDDHACVDTHVECTNGCAEVVVALDAVVLGSAA